MVKSFTLLHFKISDRGKFFHLGLFRLSFPESLDSTYWIKRFLNRCQASKVNSFTREPYPQIPEGCVSLSHKKTTFGEVYAVAYTTAFRALGVDLELCSNWMRCNRVIQRYNVNSLNSCPIEAFTTLEAGVKAFTQISRSKIYLSNIRIHEDTVSCDKAPGVLGYRFIVSSGSFKICVVIIQ